MSPIAALGLLALQVISAVAVIASKEWDKEDDPMNEYDTNIRTVEQNPVSCVEEAEKIINSVLEELKAAESDLYFALNDIKWIAERSYDDIGADEWEAVSNTILDTLCAMEGDDEQID